MQWSSNETYCLDFNHLDFTEVPLKGVNPMTDISSQHYF